MGQRINRVVMGVTVALVALLLAVTLLARAGDAFWGQVDKLASHQAVVEAANVLITASSTSPTPTTPATATASPSGSSAATPSPPVAATPPASSVTPPPPPVAATPPATSSTLAGQPYFRGLDLFGGWQSAYGGTDQFPTAAQLDYYKAKGLNWFRVPLLWEHLQPTLNAPLDAQYLAMMDVLVSAAAQRGQHISFTFIDQGQRPVTGGAQLGSADLPDSAFVDVWVRLATHYHGNPTIYAYDLMNEPWHSINWPQSAQQAITAIRAVDAVTPIIAEPLDEQPWRYTSSFSGYRGGNIWYEAHVYGDVCGDPSGWGVYDGTYDSNCGTPDRMVSRVAPFVQWCQQHQQTCIVGEYGVPGTWGGGTWDSRWGVMLTNLLNYLDANHISSNYWEVGPYGDANSADPQNGQDAPQMVILTQHRGTR